MRKNQSKRKAVAKKKAAMRKKALAWFRERARAAKKRALATKRGWVARRARKASTGAKHTGAKKKKIKTSVPVMSGAFPRQPDAESVPLEHSGGPKVYTVYHRDGTISFMQRVGS
jgi:hypothetical protein